MKKKLFIASGITLLLSAGSAFAQSSSEINKTQVQNGTSPTVEVTKITPDSRIPSAFQFLIGMCELKDNVYYMPRTKFEGLTENQRNYVLTNKSLFVIED